jgi:hypothetical protein
MVLLVCVLLHACVFGCLCVCLCAHVRVRVRVLVRVRVREHLDYHT